MQKNNQIKEAVIRALIKEATKQVTPDECDRLIGDIRRKLVDLNSKFAQMGIDPQCKPVQQIRKMNHILAGLDPVEINMASYFKPTTKSSAQSMIGESEEIKMSVEDTPANQRKAIDLAKKNGMDINLRDDE